MITFQSMEGRAYSDNPSPYALLAFAVLATGTCLVFADGLERIAARADSRLQDTTRISHGP